MEYNSGFNTCFLLLVTHILLIQLYFNLCKRLIESSPLKSTCSKHYYQSNSRLHFNNYEKVVQVVNNHMMLVTIKLCNTELLKVKVHSDDRVSVFSGFIC